MRTDNEIPQAVATAITALTGVVMRHGPDEDTRTFVAMATRLGEGMWATTADNVYGGSVYDQFTGTRQLIDLWIHPVDGGQAMPVQWGHMSIITPIAILFTPADMGSTRTGRAHAPAMAGRDYAKIWRHSFGGAQVFADNDFDVAKPSVAVEGCIYDLPSYMRWSYEHERAAPCVRANMDYPGRKDIGGPVLDETGSIAGVLIGPDWGTGGSHAGYYVPMDYVDPSVAMSLVCRKRGNGGRHSLDVDRVSHQSHDVEFE